MGSVSWEGFRIQSESGWLLPPTLCHYCTSASGRQVIIIDQKVCSWVLVLKLFHKLEAEGHCPILFAFVYCQLKSTWNHLESNHLGKPMRDYWDWLNLWAFLWGIILINQLTWGGDTNPEATPFPGLSSGPHEKEEASQAWPFIILCFLTMKAVWPDASSLPELPCCDGLYPHTVSPHNYFLPYVTFSGYFIIASGKRTNVVLVWTCAAEL